MKYTINDLRAIWFECVYEHEKKAVQAFERIVEEVYGSEALESETVQDFIADGIERLDDMFYC